MKYKFQLEINNWFSRSTREKKIKITSLVRNKNRGVELPSVAVVLFRATNQKYSPEKELKEERPPSLGLCLIGRYRGEKWSPLA